MLYSVAGVAAVSVMSGAFLKKYAPLGSSPNQRQRDRFAGLDNYREGKFANADEAETEIHMSEGLSMLKDSLFAGDVQRHPIGELPVAEIDWELIKSEQDSVTWFGHSSVLLSLDGHKLFIDPMLGDRASPLSFAGSLRYSKGWLEVAGRLPAIDAVLLTHDHYDHLDYESIRALKDKVGHFYVPLGVGAHLLRWGVEAQRITELNWWDEVQLHGLTLALTPSKHFSGRGLFNRNSTLWGGWAVIGDRIRFYTSGDGGYGSHFKEIGEKYGPFDIALMEGGQYDTRWETSHMAPEQSVQAALDIRGDKMMLVHWAAFTLAFHSWTDPIERASKEAVRQGVELVTPQVGETLPLEKLATYTSAHWWER
ncbi:MBL fold metallo-hydrolase [Planococcus sp. CP5-4]|nr:MBL fold metallo-hydrolase [Planococcus sp. CP5-4_YE]MBV0908414.1 MBL fold metallo-hydrolase [Planococcus sp. CP5-4_UN]MBW6062628.1 MBL fold metallo-hydrolase [Planococcus sp. CP5-4]